MTAAGQVLAIMVSFKQWVVPCIPPEYDCMTMYLDAFEQQLQPRVESLVTEMDVLEVDDIMRMIDWLEYYVHQMGVFDAALLERPMCGQFLGFADELVNEYLHRIKTQVMQWFTNIQKRQVDIIKGNGGFLLTSVPEDMFNVIYMQVEVAKEHLPKPHLKEVVNACLQVLREVQRQTHDTLGQRWKAMDPGDIADVQLLLLLLSCLTVFFVTETLSATINDTDRMHEQCHTFGDQVVSLVVQPEDKLVLLEMLEDVKAEYISLAIKSVGFLARCIVSDLDEPVFTRLYSKEWESGDAFFSIISATLTDYFNDVQSWLPEKYYSKFTCECLSYVVSQYCMAIRRLAVGSFQFNSELLTARRMIENMETLTEFFMPLESVLQLGGMQGTVEGELVYLRHLALIASCTHISGAEPDAKALFGKWGKDGLKIVNCLINSNPTMSKSEKQENIEFASKMFDNYVVFFKTASRIHENAAYFIDDLFASDNNGGVVSTKTAAIKKGLKISLWGMGN
jgi:hypothetical protein